jgi:eukaryotic-like serine/threonine-protein kinase
VHPFIEGQKDHELLESDYPQGEAHFSPDGHWLAYVSEENGRPEIYVLPFPSLSGKIQISTAGGSQPRWRRDSRELFFIAPDGTMMAVSVEANEGTFKAEAPRPLFRTQITAVADGFYQYDVSADGQKFIINTRATEQAPAPITILVNWEAELKR